MPDEKLGMLAGAPVTVLKVTLCVTPVGLFHVTVEPLVIVTEVGLKLLSVPMHTVPALGVHVAPGGLPGDGLPGSGATPLSPPPPPQDAVAAMIRAAAIRLGILMLLKVRVCPLLETRIAAGRPMDAVKALE